MPTGEKRGGAVRPKNIHSKAYEKELARDVVNPMLRRARQAMAGARRDWNGAVQAIAAIPEDPEVRRLGAEAAERHVRRLERYHRRRMLRGLQKAIGIDLGPLSSEAGVSTIMREAIRENVDLISTIPRRFHNRLKKRMLDLAQTAPFDEAELSGVLRKEFKSEGWNLRRLTRDQTSKTIGKFTGARHKQAGVTEYIWQTSGDERVRESHALLDGTRQSWAVPPDPGHPGEDILCRCVAIPIIPKSDGEGNESG